MQKLSLFYFKDLGRVEYNAAWNYQKKLFSKLITSKNQGKHVENILLFCEHPNVYTLGKHGNRNNLLITNEILKQKNISFFPVDRGGDITYHGPGQLVGYPIFDLDTINISIKQFVYNIEEMLILSLKEYNIEASRIKNATGVWIDAENPKKARKIAAIGMRIHNKISMHGFALNVNTNLDYFKYIVPCGIKDKDVTSMQKELDTTLDIQTVKKKVLANFDKVFGISHR